MKKQVKDFGNKGMGFTDLVSYVSETGSSSSHGRATFQWGGTIFALLLLILNRTGPRSSLQTTLLVFYLLTSLPNVFFNIVRGEFGYWLSFLAVAAHLFLPEGFPVSRFILFVITPDYVAKGLRESSAGCIFCLVIGVLLVLTMFRDMREVDYCRNGCHCFCYVLCLAFLLLFTILLWG
ncbi:Cold-regulated protein [Trema orientale]|uniref:Cold-regulated protein n=1 Tax=Trema orientale TaxID=63057 RepID=A0A2P5FXU2_TREOI|nr:Cold-regulated protein [Trema orientale]